MPAAPTNRLYYTDAYRTTFAGTVIDRDADGTRVYLDATAFYPTSGGQPHDLGTLAGVPVTDVVDEGDRIAHVLASPLPPSESSAEGSIDWDRRFDHMQQHTGQHLVSAVFEDLFGFPTVSVHFGPDYSTLDVETESVSRQQLLMVEAHANAIVCEARPVVVTFEDAATAVGLRKASDREGTLRIVSITGLDRSACGGTHVKSTAEIGPVLLRAMEKVRKTMRIEFVCGQRAVRRARRDFEALGKIAASLSASADEAADLVAGQADRLKDADNARKRLEKELATYRVRERYDAAAPDSSGLRTIVIRDAANMDDVRALAQAAFSLRRVVVIGALSNPPSVLMASSEDSGVDAGRAIKERLSAVGGRGGGSPRIAQGSIPSVEAVESVVSSLLNRAD